MSEDHETLAELPLLQHLSDEQRERVINAGHERSLARGDGSIVS